MSTYRVGFKNGQTVDVKASKIGDGRIFGKPSLVLLKEDDSANESAYIPFDEILYVLPLEAIDDSAAGSASSK